MGNLEINRVLSLFSLFSDLEGEALDKWMGFCEAAARSVGNRVREDVDADAWMEELCAAAAGVAYADYLAVQAAGGGGGEVRVGDISLRAAGENTGAEEIRAHFLGAVAHLLTPECPVLIAAGGKR